MINEGRCKNVRPFITAQDCSLMQERPAQICNGCTSPAFVKEPEIVVAAETVIDNFAHLPGGQIVETVKAAVAARPGIFVDFTGNEDLLERFKDAAASQGMKAGESALDLIYLFDAGLLCLSEEF